MNCFRIHPSLNRLFPVLGLLVAFHAGWLGAAPLNCGSPPIRLAFYEYGFFYDKGKGIDKDIVDELIRRSGCRFDTQVMTRARIWAELAEGNLDMSVSGIQNAERDRFAWFAPYLSMKNHVVLHVGAAATVRRSEDFLANSALQFGVVRAFKHGVEQDQWLEQLRSRQRVQESPNAETVFRKIKERRVDAMFSQPPVYRKFIEELDLHKEVAIQDWTPAEKGVPHGLILAKSRFSATDAEQWRALLGEMRADGALKRIFSRYLPAGEVQRMLEF